MGSEPAAGRWPGVPGREGPAWWGRAEAVGEDAGDSEAGSVAGESIAKGSQGCALMPPTVPEAPERTTGPRRGSNGARAPRECLVEGRPLGLSGTWVHLEKLSAAEKTRFRALWRAGSNWLCAEREFKIAFFLGTGAKGASWGYVRG